MGIALGKIHAAVLLFGLAGLFGKFLDLAPILIVLGRVLFASAALALLAAATRKPLHLGSRRDYLVLAASGLILALHWTTFFQSIRVSTVAIGLVSFATFPLFVVALEALFSRERIRAESLILAALTLAGAYLVVPDFDPGNSATQGILWGLASALTFALLSLINRRKVQDIPSLSIAFWQDLFAALALLPLVLLAPQTKSLTARDLWLLAALGVACTALAHTLFIGGLKQVRTRTASIIASLEPVYGILFALLFLGEVPSARTLAGGALILGAAFWSTLRG